MTINEIIKQERERQRLTRYQLGKATGISIATISNIEEGKDFRVSNMLALFEALHIKIEIHGDRFTIA